MEHYFVYVLKSIPTGRLYKGSCANLELRLYEHNSGKTVSTKPFRPWKIVYFEEFNSRYEALAREKYFKTAAGRKYLKTLF